MCPPLRWYPLVWFGQATEALRSTWSVDVVVDTSGTPRVDRGQLYLNDTPPAVLSPVTRTLPRLTHCPAYQLRGLRLVMTQPQQGGNAGAVSRRASMWGYAAERALSTPRAWPAAPLDGEDSAGALAVQYTEGYAAASAAPQAAAMHSEHRLDLGDRVALRLSGMVENTGPAPLGDWLLQILGGFARKESAE